MNIVRITRAATNDSLSSHIVVNLAMCHFAEKQGIRCYVDMFDQPMKLYADDSRVGFNQWNWFIEQPHRLNWEDAENAPLWVWEWDGWKPPNPVDAAELEAIITTKRRTDEQWAIFRAVVRKYLRIKPLIWLKAGKRFQKHGIEQDRTIAISHRGSNKSNESEVAPPDAYFPIIDAIQAENPTCDKWLKAEELPVENAFRERYVMQTIPSFYTMQSQDSSTYSDVLNGKSGHEKARDVVLMIAMMSQCQWFIRNAGNMSDLAAALSDGECHRV